ncbi:MAG: hypothetical protein IJX90_10025 [Blautia sp.]|nr:hypothetical protein [Blautia sp.]
MRGLRGHQYRYLPGLAILTWALVLMLVFSVPAEEQGTDDMAEWTVMMYFCGSDLESVHGMATYNLEEMSKIHPDMTREEFIRLVYEEDIETPYYFDRVNVVFETGGCKEWHAKDTLGLDISTEKLQRWRFSPVEEDSGENPFTLLEEKPLASMSEPETLSDFISWGAENYPAEKYALVLWDHGGGGATGIFVDELFNKDILYLDELETALKDGGVHFETVVMDACMMANLETALAVAPQASYMVASEESTSGYGSAFGDWLWELYRNPERDGRQFGMCVCDTTIRKYSQIGDDQRMDLQTYSVLDLSHVESMEHCFDEIFDYVDQAYMKYPDVLSYLDDMTQNVDKFGGEKTPMLDIGGFLYSKGALTVLPLELRARAQNTLNDCVPYCVRGKARSGASGLSFCYAINFGVHEMEVYSRNCRSPHYLSYLDAISDWEAPESVYDKVPRLTKISESEIYQFTVENVEHEGFPAAAVSLDQMTGVGKTHYYEWYMKDEDTGGYMRLGKDECKLFYDEETQMMIFQPDEPETWVSIDGVLCALEMINSSDTEDLYNIPIRMNNEIFNLRCGLKEMIGDESGDLISDEDNLGYEVYGIWNGYDADTGMPSRNVVTMADYQGRDYRFLYPIYEEGTDSVRHYVESEDMTMFRNLYIEEMELPAGDYAIRYIITDLHGRERAQEMQYIHWDGTAFSQNTEQDAP